MRQKRFANYYLTQTRFGARGVGGIAPYILPQRSYKNVIGWQHFVGYLSCVSLPILAGY
jgi:hypothetical protein